MVINGKQYGGSNVSNRENNNLLKEICIQIDEEKVSKNGERIPYGFMI